jgi:hypothetical protein
LFTFIGKIGVKSYANDLTLIAAIQIALFEVTWLKVTGHVPAALALPQVLGKYISFKTKAWK